MLPVHPPQVYVCSMAVSVCADPAKPAITSHVYVCGGFNGVSRLETLQEYCIATDSWSHKPSVGHPLWGNSLVAHDRTATLWTLGGYDGYTIRKDVWVYNIHSENW